MKNNPIKKIILVLVLFILIFAGVNTIFAKDITPGFASSSIWYSDESLTEGEKVKVYVTLFNPLETEFTGKINFYDNGKLLEKKDFSLKAKEAKIYSIDWVPDSGNHIVFAKITQGKYLNENGEYRDLEINNIETKISEKVVKEKPKPLTANTSDNENDIDLENNNVLEINNIKENIKENTPEEVSTVVKNTISLLEDTRKNILDYSSEKKEENKTKIETLKGDFKPEEEDGDGTQEETEEVKENLKPFYYVGWFFFTLISYILKIKVLFYLLLLWLIFITLRFIWRLIF
jgi:hypothetical protein